MGLMTAADAQPRYAVAVIEETLLEAIEKMEKAVDHVQGQFTTVRTGRANPALVDKLQVEYYGSMVPLQQLAGFQVPEARTLVVKPHDRTTLTAIEKAIRDSDLGVSPSNDGVVIRINIPPLTEDRRKDLCKLASKYAEEGKVALRNLRRDGIDQIKKQEKDTELSEDQSRDEQDKIQKLTDRFISELEKHLADKETDILKV